MPIELGSHYRVDVIAKLNGEDCNCGFEYVCGAAGQSMLEFLTDFQSLWQAEIIPLVVDRYAVQLYTIRQFGAVVWKSKNKPPDPVPTWPDVTPLVRYSDYAELAGDAVDDVGDITTAEMPSLVAVSAYKRCGPTTKMDLSPMAYDKFIKGGTRFGGIPKSASDDAAGNVLNAAALAAWQDAASALRLLSFASGDGGNYGMEVWSLYVEGKPRVADGAPIAARATVSQFRVNADLGHQVSRAPGRGD